MFESDKRKLEDLRSKNPEVVDKRFDQFIKELDYEVDNDGNNKTDFLSKLGINRNRDILYMVIIYLAITIYGAYLLVPDYMDNLGLLFFGMVFFIAGIQIGFGKETRGFGLIFVFSHGGTGLGCIIASLLTERFDFDKLSDLSSNLKLYIIITIAILIIAILGMVVYNISDTLNKRKYNKVIILLLFAAVIFLVGMLPVLNF